MLAYVLCSAAFAAAVTITEVEFTQAPVEMSVCKKRYADPNEMTFKLIENGTFAQEDPEDIPDVLVGVYIPGRSERKVQLDFLWQTGRDVFGPAIRQSLPVSVCFRIAEDLARIYRMSDGVDPAAPPILRCGGVAIPRASGTELRGIRR